MSFTKIIQSSRLITASILSAGVMALSNCSSGTVERDYICDSSGCQPVSSTIIERDQSKSPSSPNTTSTLTLESRITNSDGNAVVLGQLVSVVDEFAEPLEDITLYGLGNGQQTLYLAVDQNGTYVPTMKETERNALATTRSRKEDSGKKQGALHQEDVTTLLMEAWTWGKQLLAVAGLAERGTLLSEDENVNLYCMSKEQMTRSYIYVPAGILFLTTQEKQISGKTIKLADTILLGELFEGYLQAYYGEAPAYLVAVPKTTINLCEADNQEPVCPISADSFSDLIWSKQSIPVWEIRGSCSLERERNSEQGYAPPKTEAAPENQEEQRDPPVDVITDPTTGWQWQKNASPKMMSRKEAGNYCQNLSLSGENEWQLPSAAELKTIMHGDADCLLLSSLEGSCSWYWARDETCNYVDSPWLQINFSPLSVYNQQQCTNSINPAYVRCIRK